MRTARKKDSPNFDTVWKLFQESKNEAREASKEMDKRFKETDKQFKETDKQFKETDKRFRELEGYFSSQWGKFIESLVEGDLVNLLRTRNIPVNRTATNYKFLFEGKEYEFDILAVNTQEVVVVEVKTSLKVQDIRWFLDKLDLFRKIFREFESYKVYGAVAYLKANEAADKFAYRHGLFAIRATGNSAVITNDKDFEPRIF